MKTLIVFVAIVSSLTLFVSSVSAKGLGVSAPENSVMNNETGRIETLYTKTLDDGAKAFIKGYVDGTAEYVVDFTPTSVQFVKFRTSLNGAFSVSANGLVANFLITADMVSFDIFTGKPLDTSVGSVSITKSSVYRPYLIGYNPYILAGYSMSNYNYIWTPVNNDVEGKYWVIFDEGDGGQSNGILDWLKNFWDNLLKFFIDLFVPPDGYFENWFEEIRNAFMGKMGGLGELFEYIQSSFEKLKDGSHKASSIKLELPKDFLYKGYEGVTGEVLGTHIAPMLKWLRGILTAIVICFTAVLCMNKVIALVKN